MHMRHGRVPRLPVRSPWLAIYLRWPEGGAREFMYIIYILEVCPMVATDHYTIITADTHAGGSHAQYREYLDAEFLEDFDAWRAKYKNPFKDLKDDRRSRNWDGEQRFREQQADGV